jgi:predicted nucleotidyltransferase
MHTILLDNSTVINSICKTYKVEKLYAFGSVLTKKFNKESDSDLLVEFKDMNLKLTTA